MFSTNIQKEVKDIFTKYLIDNNQRKHLKDIFSQKFMKMTENFDQNDVHSNEE